VKEQAKGLWDVPQEKVIAELTSLLSLKDPEITIEVSKVFTAMDAINVKRAELEMKRQAKDNEHRLRLLELARHAPVGELVRLASENGISCSSSIEQR